MSGDRTDRAIEAQGAGPLTPLQIRTLAVEARRAWHVQREMGLAEEDFDTWRHGAVQDVAPAARGLRDLTQRDFAPVRAWLRERSLTRSGSLLRRSLRSVTGLNSLLCQPNHAACIFWAPDSWNKYLNHISSPVW